MSQPLAALRRGRPPTVLFVSHSFPPHGAPLKNVGGMQRVAVELHAALAAHPGVRFHSRILEGSWRWTGVRTPGFLAWLWASLPRSVRVHGVDVVLFSSAVTAVLAPSMRRRLRARGTRLGAIVHGLDLTEPAPLWQPLVRRSLAALDEVFPVSTATARQAVARGAAPERVHVVSNGVDVWRFPAVGDRGAARAELLRWLGGAEMGIPEDALLLASVGRHVERKGFRWFVEHVVPRLPANAVYLLGGEGPETPAIRAAVRAAGVEGRVRMLGRLTEAELLRLYRGADLFLMPNVPVENDMEGFGIVILEAALCGLPTLGAGLEGIRDAVTEGQNGHLVPPGDADAYVEAIARYAGDRGALERLSARAREWVAPRYSWDRIADRFVRHWSGEAPAAGLEPERRPTGTLASETL